MDWWEIAGSGLTVVLGILSVVFGKKYRKVKKVAETAADAALVAVGAIEDDRVTQVEEKAVARVVKQMIDDARE